MKWTVPEEDYGFAGVVNRFDLFAQYLCHLHSEGVLGRGNVYDEGVHSLDLAVQIRGRFGFSLFNHCPGDIDPLFLDSQTSCWWRDSGKIPGGE